MGVELVTNAPKFIRGYDPDTGKELWRLGRSSNITAPTPVFDRDLIVVMSGRRPNAPIFVIKAGARGDITVLDLEGLEAAVPHVRAAKRDVEDRGGSPSELLHSVADSPTQTVAPAQRRVVTRRA